MRRYRATCRTSLARQHLPPPHHHRRHHDHPPPPRPPITATTTTTAAQLDNGDELSVGVALNVLNISKRLKKVKMTKAVRRTEMKALDPALISQNKVSE